MLRPPTRMSQLWMLSFNEFFAGSKWSGTIQPRWGATSSLRQSGKKAGASQSAVYISSMRVACAAPMVTLVMILPPSPGFAATVPFPRGAVLVFLESTKVERRGCGTIGDLGLWHDGFIEHFRPIAEFIRRQGAVPGIQLGHSGRRSRLERPWEGGRPLKPSPEIEDWEDWEVVGPSPLSAGEGEPPPRELSTAEVRDVVTAWGAAARRAREAGFDVL